MGIDESKPISTLVAPSSNKKLVSKTPPVTPLKIVAKTPSRVAARRLVRTDALDSDRGRSGTTTASDNAMFSETSRSGTGIVFSRMRSAVLLTILGNLSAKGSQGVLGQFL